MTLWEYRAMAIEAGRIRNAKPKPEPMSEARFEELVEQHRALNLPNVRI